MKKLCSVLFLRFLLTQLICCVFGAAVFVILLPYASLRAIAVGAGCIGAMGGAMGGVLAMKRMPMPGRGYFLPQEFDEDGENPWRQRILQNRPVRPRHTLLVLLPELAIGIAWLIAGVCIYRTPAYDALEEPVAAVLHSAGTGLACLFGGCSSGMWAAMQLRFLTHRCGGCGSILSYIETCGGTSQTVCQCAFCGHGKVFVKTGCGCHRQGRREP